MGKQTAPKGPLSLRLRAMLGYVMGSESVTIGVNHVGEGQKRAAKRLAEKREANRAIPDSTVVTRQQLRSFAIRGR